MKGNSPAQRLISSLDKNPDIQYVAYIVESTMGTDYLLTIRKTRNKLNNNQPDVVENIIVDPSSKETTINLKETPTSYSATIVKALSLNKTGQSENQ